MPEERGTEEGKPDLFSFSSVVYSMYVGFSFIEVFQRRQLSLR